MFFFLTVRVHATSDGFSRILSSSFRFARASRHGVDIIRNRLVCREECLIYILIQNLALSFIFHQQLMPFPYLTATRSSAKRRYWVTYSHCLSRELCTKNLTQRLVKWMIYRRLSLSFLFEKRNTRFFSFKL